MDTELVESGRFERTLTVKVPEAEMEDAKNKAARKLSGQIKLKGFRPGKAPRRIVEATVGAEVVRAEAIDSGMGDWVGKALEGVELEIAGRPTITDVRDTDEGVEMDVKLALWPTLDEAPVIEGRKVTVESNLVTPEEIDEQINGMREQFAELVDVERAIRDGDIALIDLNAEDNGQPVEEVSAQDLSYEVGGGGLLEGLDGVLRGAKVGAILALTSTLPESFGEYGGEELSFKVLVKAVREKQLPDLDDEWGGDVAEFENVEELRAEIEEGMSINKTQRTLREFRNKAVEAIIDEVEIEIPEPIVEAETETQLHSFAHQLDSSGIGFEDYMRITGQDQDSVVADARLQAERAVKTRLALDAIVAARGMTVSDDELEEAVQPAAEREEMTVAEYLEAVEKVNSLELLTADILRQQALEVLIDEATPIDAEGNELDLTLPDPPEDDLEQDSASEAAGEVGENEEAALSTDEPDSPAADESADETAEESAEAEEPTEEPLAEEDPEAEAPEEKDAE